jgi:hypothetical protein
MFVSQSTIKLCNSLHMPVFWCDRKSSFYIVKLGPKVGELNNAQVPERKFVIITINTPRLTSRVAASVNATQPKLERGLTHDPYYTRPRLVRFRLSLATSCGACIYRSELLYMITGVVGSNLIPHVPAQKSSIKFYTYPRHLLPY